MVYNLLHLEPICKWFLNRILTVIQEQIYFGFIHSYSQGSGIADSKAKFSSLKRLHLALALFFCYVNVIVHLVGVKECTSACGDQCIVSDVSVCICACILVACACIFMMGFFEESSVLRMEGNNESVCGISTLEKQWNESECTRI